MELRRLEPEDARPEFTCGDADLDEFYRADSVDHARELMAVTYAYVDETSGKVLAYFSLSNDSIKAEDVPRSAFSRLIRPVPRQKRYDSMPSAKIGRLGTCSEHQSRGIGRDLLDYIKAWFAVGNKTGCRFLVVDANNNPRTIKFYSDNGFQFLTGADEREETRIMFFDLSTFRP